MSDWSEKISGCFGLADRKFAGHPSDEKQAFELLTQLRKEHVGWEEFEKQLRVELSDMPKLNIDEQVALVRGAFRFWLLD